ncbi:MAG: ComEC family competence protein, partial [Muribaculaceae bacterium]|nr:ComEC family competence protein [Muribaculaceae bacterium]
MAGILLFGFGVEWYLIAIAAAVSVALLYFPDRFYTFGVLAIAAGWFCASVHAPASLPASMHGSKVKLSAEVLRIEPSGDYSRLLVAADTIGGVGLGSPVRVWISLLSNADEAGIGSRIQAEGFLRDAAKFDGLPYETDYAAFAAVDRVSATMTAGSDAFCVITPGNGIGERLRQYRNHLADAIYLSGLNERTADFVVATVCGDDNNLSPEVRETFRTLGLAHLLALSGFHVALFAGLVSLLLYPLRLWRSYVRWRHAAVLAAVWFYVLVSGMSASAVRAALMLSILLGGKMMQRQGPGFNTLAAAALLMLVWNPGLLYSPGFQLSFTAVAGLMAFAEQLNPFGRRRRWPHLLMSIITAPVAAVLGTTVVSALYFHSFPLLFLPANAVMTLLSSLIIGGGAVLSLVAVCGGSCGILAWTLDGLYSVAVSFCRVLTALPHTEIAGLYPTAITALLLAAAIILAAVALNRRRHLPWIMAAICVMLSFGAQRVFAEENPYGELYIPSHSAETRVIMRQGEAAMLYCEGSAPAAHATLASCSRRYETWLRMRRCHANFRLRDSVDMRAGGFGR